MRFHLSNWSSRTVLLVLFLAFRVSVYALDHVQPDTYFNHLREVNKEWANFKAACPDGTIAFRSDLDRIQLHLYLVIDHLKANAPEGLTADQLANRIDLLNQLRQYADEKVFPVNKYHLVRQPYFVDEFGTNCAVGQMIYLSGHQELVDRISQEHNYDYLADIKTEGVSDWAEAFGFTLEELAWIQPTYSPTAVINQVLGGANGPVKKLVRKGTNGLIIAGEFTELDEMPCLNIGLYTDNQLTCVGEGIDGVIRDVHYEGQSGAIYAFGELYHESEVYPVAKFINNTWTFLSIPNRSSATTTAGYGLYSEGSVELAISHSSNHGWQEVWRYLGGDDWEKRALLNGIIFDIGNGTYVGHFDTAFIYQPDDNIDTMVVNNVLIRSNEGEWYGVGENVSDTVNVVTKIGGALYFGGTCSSQPGENNICISRYLNSTAQPLYLHEFGNENYAVNSIAYNSGFLSSSFIFGGKFRRQVLGGINGNNLASYNLVNNRIEALAVFDGPVNSLTFLDDELFIGGSFQTNQGDDVNYLAKEESITSTDELADYQLKFYPNPFTNTIQLTGIENGANYALYGTDGRMLKQGVVQNGSVDGLDFLPQGAYVLQIASRNGILVEKVFK